jgi:hypothetical protein
MENLQSNETRTKSEAMNVQIEDPVQIEETDVDINEFQQLIKDSLDNCDLSQLPTDCLGVLADQLYDFGLINEVLKSQPSIDGCINEFKTSIDFLKEVSLIEAHCRKFLQALALIGGSYKLAANAIHREWTNTANKRLKYEIKLLQSHSEDVALLENDEERLKCVLKEVLESYRSKLNDFSDAKSLENLANKLFSLQIITQEVERNPSIDGFLSEFADCIDMSTGVLEIQSECNKFLKAVTALGGKYAKLAKLIKKKLVEEVNNEFNILFTLHI